MALKAGYYGMKKRFMDSVKTFMSNHSDDLSIKSLGTGLTLSAAGELSADVSPSVETSVDLSTCDVKYIENQSVMSVVDTASSLTFDYGSGSQIGARYAKLYDMSLFDFIKLKINVTSIYSSSFPAKVGIADTSAHAQSGSFLTSISKGVTEGAVDLTLDVRGLNGELYLTFDGTGDDVVFSDVKIISQVSEDTTTRAKSKSRKK